MITQEQKDQIRKMAEEKYPLIKEDGFYDGLFVDAETQVIRNTMFCKTAEAVLERMYIDEIELGEIMRMWCDVKDFTTEEAKQQILDAIRISG